MPGSECPSSLVCLPVLQGVHFPLALLKDMTFSSLSSSWPLPPDSAEISGLPALLFPSDSNKLSLLNACFLKIYF